MTVSQYTPGSSVTVIDPAVVIAGVNTQVGAVVGTFTMGPVNVATPATGSVFQSTFGAPQPRKYDGGTVVNAAGLNGAGLLYVTRVTDGTDTKATASISNANISSIYTGSGYNGTLVSYGAGGKANSITVTVNLAGSATEVYQNLPASNAFTFWSAHDAAINAGAGVLRGPSLIITANSAAATQLPSLPTSVTLSGGTDGASGVTGNTLVGVDGTTKSGMYTLRNLGVQFAVLADCDASSTYTTQAAFGEAENILMIATLPAGTTVANAVSTKQSVGLDSNRTVLLHGNWLTYNDPVNGLRKISPQGFYLGARASLMPNQSVLNKVISGIVASERSQSGGPFTSSDTDTLFQSGVELIDNPIPRGAAWGAKGGCTTTSNDAEDSDSWATMTNFLAQTFAQAGGPYVGENNNSTTQTTITAAFNHFLAGLVSQGILANDSSGNAPYSVVCNSTNNTADDITLGYINVGVTVQYQGIIKFFNVSLQGGAGVVVTVSAAA